MCDILFGLYFIFTQLISIIYIYIYVKIIADTKRKRKYFKRNRSENDFKFSFCLFLIIIRTFLSSVGWLFGFYGISTIVGYLMPNPFLYK